MPRHAHNPVIPALWEAHTQAQTTNRQTTTNTGPVGATSQCEDTLRGAQWATVFNKKAWVRWWLVQRHSFRKGVGSSSWVLLVSGTHPSDWPTESGESLWPRQQLMAMCVVTFLFFVVVQDCMQLHKCSRTQQGACSAGTRAAHRDTQLSSRAMRCRSRITAAMYMHSTQQH